LSLFARTSFVGPFVASATIPDPEGWSIKRRTAGRQWLSFNAREDFLKGRTVGTTVEVARAGTRETMPSVVTELRPLGTFATWQAERAVGDPDRNTLRLRLDPHGDPTGLEPGMTVWIAR
jgi:HlyD family secretion protein